MYTGVRTMLVPADCVCVCVYVCVCVCVRECTYSWKIKR